jgi:hypothetical protein
MGTSNRWTEPGAQKNARALQAKYPAVFDAIAEYDKLGHEILARVGRGHKVSHFRQLIAIAFLRRAVTLFTSFRQLVEGASVEPAKLVLRSLFETYLALVYLIYGGPLPVDSGQRLLPDEGSREKRARQFHVAGLRRQVYRHQAVLDGELGDVTLDAEKRKQINAEITDLRQRLGTRYAAENAEFGPLGIDGKKRVYWDSVQWYSLGSGPRSIRGLAHKLGHKPEYEVLYDALSALTHPRSMDQDVVVTQTEVHVLHPHNIDAFEVLTRWAVLNYHAMLVVFCTAEQRTSIGEVMLMAKHAEAVRAMPFDLPASFL